MSSTGFFDTGARLSIGGSIVNIAVNLDYNVSRTDNTVTFTGLAQTNQYQRLTGSITSFTYNTGWEAYAQIPAGVANRTGQFSSGARNVNTNYGPTGGSDFAIGVGATDTTTTGQMIGRYLNDGMTGSGAFAIGIPALGYPALSSQSVSAIKPTTATVNSSFSAGSNSSGISSIQLQYGLTTGYGSTASGGTINLTGLKPGKTYHYRFVTTNNGGLSVTTSDFTFKTLGIAGHTPILMGLL